MHASSRPRTRRWLARGVLVALTVGALALGGVGDEPTVPIPLSEVPLDATNVLQTVSLQVGHDGTIRTVTSDAVAENAEKMKSSEVWNEYSPAEVVDALPVRLTTSYRTDTSQGTNLADLAGYTGRVVIELKVQNLTMKPTTVDYDAGGRSVQEPALVGVPMTVFAATTLRGTVPSAVVLDGEEEGQGHTNGVLAQLPDGATSVQWAKLLTPPATADSATLRLVVDAKNMQVPDFDLSVHPGVVSDPRASFMNSATESETELLKRTVTLAGDVQLVLDDVGESITELRKVLATSTETFGAEAVAGLKQSNQQVETSTQSLVSQLQGLQSSLDQQLGATQSAMLSTLQQGVASMQGLLGDPARIQAETPQPLPGGGCSAEVPRLSGDGSVSGLIAQVSIQLDQFANASESCRVVVRDSILASLGPEDPSQEGACPAPPAATDDGELRGRVDDGTVVAPGEPTDKQQQVPVTCALWDARNSAKESISQQFGEDRDALLLTLKPESFDETLAKHEELGRTLTVVKERFEALDDGITQPDLEAIRSSLKDFSTSLTSLEGWMKKQHEFANSQKASTSKAVEQNREAAEELCQLIQKAEEPDPGLARVYGSLTDKPCVLADGTELTIPSDVPESSLQERWGNQQDAWDTVSSETDPEKESSGPALVAALRTAEQKVSTELTNLEQLDGDNDESAEAARKSLSEAIQGLETTNTELGENLQQLVTSQKQAREDLKKTFDQVIGNVDAEVSEAFDPAIRQIRVDGERAAASWDRSATTSADQLRDVSRDLSAGGQKTIEERAQALRDTSDAASEFISGQLSAGGQVLAENLGNSAQDIDGTRAQLVLDLQNALADLGDPTVDGGGLLGTMATSTATAATTDEQVALATSATTSFSNVRSEDVGGLEKRRAVFLQSLEASQDLDLFQLRSTPEARTTTVYTIHIGSGQS